MHDLGALLQERGRPEAAEAALRLAVALDPAAVASGHALAITLMTLGQYTEGWKLYRMRHAMAAQYRPARPVGFPFPELRDGAVTGKHVVVFPEQGHGDQLRDGLPGTIVELAPERSGAADFAETAAPIEQLDLVVSVDTAVAHLAGALGKRCLTLIPGYAADWRWMAGRDDSPWYPGMTLYRGPIDGDWGDAIVRLAADARRVVAAE